MYVIINSEKVPWGKVEKYLYFNLKRGEKNRNSLIILAIEAKFMLQCTFCIMGQRVDIFSKDKIRDLS